MARAPDKRIEQARKLYLRGVKLVEIARRLEVPEGTVRRWKSTQKWSTERSSSFSERSNAKSERSENASRQQKNSTGADESFDIENSDLSEKQKLFCIYYVRCFNATKAYQKAYGCKYETALTNGPALLGNTRIKSEIRKLKKDKLNQEFLSEEDIFQKYIDIAFADITDYVEFNKSGVWLKNSEEADGTIISEVKKGKDGITLKLADRMKALQWLADHMDLATEEQRTRIDVMKAKAQLGEEAESVDDGFLEALKGTAGEDWADEEETETGV